MSARGRARPAVMTLALLVALPGLLPVLLPVSAPAQSSRVPALLRKAETSAREDGFCKSVRAPRGSRASYVHWLEQAEVGTTKLNSFDNGSCQFDEVTRVSFPAGHKCVHYTWYNCQPDQSCATGADVECRDGRGAWKRQPRVSAGR